MFWFILLFLMIGTIALLVEKHYSGLKWSDFDMDSFFEAFINILRGKENEKQVPESTGSSRSIPDLWNDNRVRF